MLGCMELIENQMQRVVVQTIDEVDAGHGGDREIDLKD